MPQSKFQSQKIYGILSILIIALAFISMLLDSYVFPKIAIYKVSNPNPALKMACVQDYKESHLRHGRNYWVIDNNSYQDLDVRIKIATALTLNHAFPIDYNHKKLIDDIRNKERECYLVSYVEVINLGFFRKFYLYQYIE